LRFATTNPNDAITGSTDDVSLLGPIAIGLLFVQLSER
jgi:hypothetical protein